MSISQKKKRKIASVYPFDAHHCFLAQCAMTFLVFSGLTKHVSFPIQILLSWDAFAFTGIILSWMTIVMQDPNEIKQRARLKETTRHFLFFIVIFAAVASFIATWLLLTSAKAATDHHISGVLALAILTPFLSWFLVHTRFAIQYAYLYYVHSFKKEDACNDKSLIFPGREDHPDYLDFAYFSFVIGMTCQVSDVQIAKKELRRLAMVHGLISFAFNTAILALLVNIVASIF